jgi:putative endonuclease
MKTIHQYYVYILASRIRGTLYIGMTNDLQRRVYEHKTGLIKGFSKKHGVSRLMYFEVFKNVNEAIDREKNLKKWKRDWKIRLIEKENKPWLDLSQDWYNDILVNQYRFLPTQEWQNIVKLNRWRNRKQNTCCMFFKIQYHSCESRQTFKFNGVNPQVNIIPAQIGIHYKENKNH